MNAKTVMIDISDIGVHKMGFGHQVGMLRRGVQFSGKIVAIKPLLLKNIDPFCSFQRNPVRTGKAGRNESHIMLSAAKSALSHFSLH